MSQRGLLINSEMDEDDIPAEPEGDMEHPQDAQGYGERSPREILANLIKQIDDVNIAASVDEQTLQTLGQLVVSEYQIDETSRVDWRDGVDKALDFATQKTQEKQFPWPKASNTIFPIISSAALQFQARTYPAIIQNRNVVKGVVWGSDKGTPALDADKKPMMDPVTQQPVWLSAPGEKRQRADKIGQHMSYQLLEEMPDWEPQTDMLLGQIPIVGGGIRKTFYDPVDKCNKSLFVPITDLCWNFYAPCFETAPRHTETVRLYPTEIETLERSELFLPHVYGPGADVQDDTAGGEATPSQGSDPDAPHIFLEQHRRFDLDGDGYAEPLVVTVHKGSARVVRITARYDEDGITANRESEIVQIKPCDHYTLYPFLPNPKSGSHPIGFGHLLKPLNEAINTSLNQMFDAGTLQNTGGGFIGTSLSLHSGPINFQVGRYVPVNNKGQNIRDSVYTIPWPGPSNVLFQLLGLLIGAAKELAGVQDILTGDAGMANASPTTILALIEQGSKVYTSIHKRVYRAMKAELQKLYALNRKHITEEARYRVGDEWLEVSPDDYRLGGGVEPIADPTMVTDMQRLGRAEVLMTLKDDPQCNGMEIRRRYLEYVGIDRVDEILVPPNPVPAQIAMANAQAELGKMRSEEQRNTAQAMLYLAQARNEAAGVELEQLDKLLETMRLHLEALNTANKAAEIESKHHIAMTGIKQDARESAAATSPKPALAGANAGSVPAMAPQPDNAGLSPIPGRQPGGLPGQGSGPAII
jgi:chaperonin GroES